jgi:hypothetical protein
LKKLKSSNLLSEINNVRNQGNALALITQQTKGNIKQLALNEALPQISRSMHVQD